MKNATKQPSTREARIDFLLAIEALLKAAETVKQHRDRLLGKQDAERQEASPCK
jgi:hypothetical protein